MKNSIMKRTASLSHAGFPYCPVTTLPGLPQFPVSHDARVEGHEHPAGEEVTSASRNGRRFIMTALIGVKESMNDSEMADLLRSLRSNSAITSARQSRTSHFLFIEYDPSLSQRRDILRHLGDMGLHACVAGC
ncbi:MAG: hypothetical protein WBX11_16570 [Thiobacillaceae bacterium]